MDSLLMGVGIALVALAVAYLRHQSKSQQLKRAFALADDLVPAIEQLAETGQIAKEQKLTTVMAELKVHFPGLEEKHLRWAAEKAVYWMKNNSYVNLSPVEYNIELVEGLTEERE